MDVVEKAGSGIKRMRDAMKAEVLPKPKFEFHSFFIKDFKRPTYEELKQKLTGKVPEKSQINPRK